MAAFRRASNEQVNVFEVDDVYLFKHYLDDDDAFARAKEYYNNQRYRFEVPSEEFEELRSFLSDRGYGLVVVDAVAPFVVVVRQYTDHPENIPKETVMKRTVEGHNCFLMTDQDAVEQAVQEGATWLPKADLKNPF
jgi:hypothetical protein